MASEGKPKDLRERFINYAVRILRIAAALPRTPEGMHIRTQMFQAGTSCGANYGEACGAESRRDFIHKEQIVLKELRETDFWLRVTDAAGMLNKNVMGNIIEETGELISITVSSINTARRNGLNDR